MYDWAKRIATKKLQHYKGTTIFTNKLHSDNVTSWSRIYRGFRIGTSPGRIPLWYTLLSKTRHIPLQNETITVNRESIWTRTDNPVKTIFNEWPNVLYRNFFFVPKVTIEFKSDYICSLQPYFESCKLKQKNCQLFRHQ